MKRFSFERLSRLSLTACVLALPALVGCGKSDPAVFRLNLQGRSPDDFRVTSQDKEQTEKDAKKQNEASLKTVSTVLYAMFGGPDDPYVMPETGLDPRKIELASGRAGSDASGRQRGLYRQHCAHCHGITGDGAGPTAAFLNPYPRDYRTGAFKFKSTARAAKPPVPPGPAQVGLPLLARQHEREELVRLLARGRSVQSRCSRVAGPRGSFT